MSSCFDHGSIVFVAIDFITLLTLVTGEQVFDIGLLDMTLLVYYKREG